MSPRMVRAAGGDRGMVSLRLHHQPDEGAQDAQGQHQLDADRDQPRVVRVLDEEIPGGEKEKGAAEKAALLEDLVPLLLLRPVEFPLRGEAEGGDEQKQDDLPARVDREDGDGQSAIQETSRFRKAPGLICGLVFPAGAAAEDVGRSGGTLRKTMSVPPLLSRVTFGCAALPDRGCAGSAVSLKDESGNRNF